MSNALKTAAAQPYGGATKRIVSQAHQSIERAAAQALTKAGHKAPKKLAKAVRAATDALDELDANDLDTLLAQKGAFEQDLQKSIARIVAKGSPSRRKRSTSPEKPLVLGAAVTETALTDKQAALPFTDDVESIGEDDPFFTTMSTTEASDILGVSRTTAIQWIEAGKLIGLKGAKRGWRIPRAQIRRGRLAPGLEAVSVHFGDAEEAWHFLVSDQLIGEDRIRPLDLLFKKQADTVARLAEGYGRDFL